MKSWKYLKSMAKNGQLLLLCSAIIFLSSCSLSVSPTYSREEISKVIEDLCQKEFNLKVFAEEINDTVWIYRSVDKLINAQGAIDESAIDNIRNIFLSIRRVLLSMNKPPAFYVFAISDTMSAGVDLYYIGFVPDMIKFQMSYISLGEMQEREAILHGYNPKAIGDTEGKHIEKYDVKMGDFVSYLIKQHINNKFLTNELKDFFKVNQINSYYTNDTLTVEFNITPVEGKTNLTDPFVQVEDSIKKFIKIYTSYLHLVDIEIVDSVSGKRRIYSPKALFDDKFIKGQ